MYQLRSPTPLAGTTMATAPLVTITYKKEARVLQYERRLYADLGRFYLGGSAAARADWAARRAWTTQRAGVDAAPLADALARLYRDWTPQDEREARGDGACGLAIQEARRRFGRELSHDDVQLMRDLGYTLDEMIAYLAQFDDDDAAAGPGLKIYSDAELEEQGYDVHAPGVKIYSDAELGEHGSDVGALGVTTGYSSTPEARAPRTVPKGGGTATAWALSEENEDEIPAHRGAGRFDQPAVYRHLVSPLDSHDADDADPFVDAGRAATPAAIARALRESSPPAINIPMPGADAAAWQKEAVAVCRLLGPKVAGRLETVHRQLAILERPPPSRARFRQRKSRGSPYRSSPLASG